MTTSEVITKAWDALRSEKHAQSGVYERRIFANSGLSLFAALQRPAGLIQIHFHFMMKKVSIPQIDMLGMSLKQETIGNGRVRVRLELARPPFEEIFSTLAADVISKMLAARCDEEAANLLVMRLMHWQRFMQIAGPDGLSQERQAGLYGELTILRSLLIADGNAPEMIGIWHGPAGENHDFLHAGNAIEVKTSTGNAVDSVTISNEFQLDESGLLSLFLCHLCLDARDGIGTSLPALIADIRSLLPEEARMQLADLLLEAGYLESQSHLYASRGYVERRRTYYSVSGEFPRILPDNLMAGISKVQYRLNLGGCSSFRQPEQHVLKRFLGHTS